MAGSSLRDWGSWSAASAPVRYNFKNPAQFNAPIGTVRNPDLVRSALRGGALAFGQGLFTVDDGGSRMNHGSDTQSVLHAFLGSPLADHFALVRIEAHATAVDRGNRQGPELEVELVSTGVADDVHAEPRRQLAVFLVREQVHRAVVDVVHRHDRGGRLGGILLIVRQLSGSVLGDRLDHLSVAGRQSGSKRGAPNLRFGQRRRLEDVREIELDVLGIGRHPGPQSVDTHDLLPFLSWAGVIRKYLAELLQNLDFGSRYRLQSQSRRRTRLQIEGDPFSREAGAYCPGLRTAKGSGDLENLFALLPVAGAEFVGLQRVQDAQGLLRVPADTQVVHGHVADDAVRVHDEGGPQADAFVHVKDAELGGELTLQVGEHRELQVPKVLIVALPGQVNELAVRGEAEDLGIAVGKLLVQRREGCNLGRANEGKVLRPSKEDQPLALIALVVDVDKGLARRLRLTRGNSLQVEGGEFLTNG